VHSFRHESSSTCDDDHRTAPCRPCGDRSSRRPGARGVWPASAPGSRGSLLQVTARRVAREPCDACRPPRPRLRGRRGTCVSEMIDRYIRKNSSVGFTDNSVPCITKTDRRVIFMTNTSAASMSITVLVLVFGGCDRLPATPTADVTRVTVTGLKSFTALGQKSQLAAVASLPSGAMQDVTNQAAWESDNPGVASVSPTGLITVNSVGEAFVRAAYRQQIGTLRVSVLRAGPVSIDISPDTSVLKTGQSQQFSVSVVLGPGVPMPAGPVPSWSSTNRSIIEIDDQGTATAKSVGEAVIQVSFYGLTITRPFHVEP